MLAYSQSVGCKPSPGDLRDRLQDNGPSSSTSLESLPSPAEVARLVCAVFARSVSNGENDALFVVLEFVRPSLQSVFNFSVAQPVLGLLTFSLLGLYIHSFVEGHHREGDGVLSGGPWTPLRGAHALSGPPVWGSRARVCESEHL